MQSIHPSLPLRILKLLTCLLICKVTVAILSNYPDYLPPNFESEFLLGRDRYFFGGYSYAFYVHIASGPCSLILGMVLLSERFRLRFSRWHRVLGRIQVANILLLLTPSGLWMAFYAATGSVAGVGFGALAVVTGVCAALGWRAAVKRRFDVHRRWMLRCYVLLCSAVVLRLTVGLATVVEFNAEWLDPLAAWTSWLVPLVILELSRFNDLKNEVWPQKGTKSTKIV